ncbi:MAG: cytochrome c oxidase subunit II [Rhodospirillaceae bacterium]|nr:cytochrome c oxidase subunit II [Rhodospirillaceae bacterium]|tara:strand:+ start:16062 stop:16940 length:879 start_codon:yes stop_codon:yes gene_type:complete
MRLQKILSAVSALCAGVFCWLFTTGANASSAVPWQKGFQPAVTTVMEDIHKFHDLLLVIITVITIFVLGLLVYTMVRFSAKANPVPSKTTHHAMLEVVWTIVPVIILVVIAVPSFKLLYKADVVPKADMTIKAIGNQWNWGYEYPDHGNFSFIANLIKDEELQKWAQDNKVADPKRLLETDEVVVVPVNTTVRVQVTSNDVLHAWAVPAFGVKIDAVPGRLNETWFNVNKEGTYYGQCSELCGRDHGFMPIKVQVVSKAAFAKWVTAQRKAAGLEPLKQKRRDVAKLNNSAR